MYDFEAETGLTQENVERMARDACDPPTLQIICAWCKSDMVTGEPLTDEEYELLRNEATHGICTGCANDMLCETP